MQQNNTDLFTAARAETIKHHRHNQDIVADAGKQKADIKNKGAIKVSPLALNVITEKYILTANMPKNVEFYIRL